MRFSVSKYFILHFWGTSFAILLLVTTVTGAVIVIQRSGQMIDYYCSAHNRVLGIDFSVWAACPVYVTIIWIFVISSAILLLIFVLAILLDFLLFGLKVLEKISLPIYHYLFGNRLANVIVTQIVYDNKVFVIVINREPFLRADGVHADPDFKWNNRHVKGRIKWEDASVNNGEISIDRRILGKNAPYKSLRFATADIDRGLFIIHLLDGDEVIEFKDGTYHFPVIVQGKMISLLNRISKAYLEASFDVIVSFAKGKGDMSARIERHY